MTPLYRAVPFPKILQLLLNKGAKVGCMNAWDALDRAAGAQALHQAAYLGSKEAVNILLDAGADPNALNELQETPLDVAQARLRCKHEELEKYLDMQCHHQKISPSEIETTRDMIGHLGSICLSILVVLNRSLR